MESVAIDNNPEINEIKKRFEESKMTIKNITKVESKPALNVFEQEKMIVKEHLGLKLEDEASTENLRILDLYHGTRETLEQVVEEGLDIRNLKHFGHFGRGIYFSDDPTFARLEVESGDARKIIYKCKVILGNSKVYPKDETDPNLMREPRETVNGIKVSYDSVEGNVGGFTQYVVYESRRILVQFAVAYETTEQLPTLPPVPKRTEKQAECSECSGGDQSRSSEDQSSDEEAEYHTPDEDGTSREKRKKKRKKKTDKKDPPEVIVETLKHLMSIRSSHPKEVYNELVDLFYKTYIDWPSEGLKPLSVLPSEEKIQRHLAEFCSLSKCESDVEAKIFLALYNCNVNEAFLKYITMVK